MTPDTFAAELHTRIGPNYRLIRSRTHPRWRIEQKVGRATTDVPVTDDRARMLADGYVLVLDTPDSDTMRCPMCDNRVSLPVFEKAEFVCALCASHGKRKPLVDGYFPLVDRTLLYLERTHPRRGEAYRLELDAKNEALNRARLSKTRNLAEDLALDSWDAISRRLVFGYTKAGTPHSWGTGRWQAPTSR